jgi:hypothetical protein
MAVRRAWALSCRVHPDTRPGASWLVVVSSLLSLALALSGSCLDRACSAMLRLQVEIGNGGPGSAPIARALYGGPAPGRKGPGLDRKAPCLGRCLLQLSPWPEPWSQLRPTPDSERWQGGAGAHPPAAGSSFSGSPVVGLTPHHFVLEGTSLITRSMRRGVWCQ